MFMLPSKLLSQLVVVALAVLAATQAQAADRRFIPVPQGSAQSIQVINGVPILIGVGKQFQAATSVAAISSKQGRLMVSVKNQTTAPVAMQVQSVIATSAGQVLSLREASQPSAKPEVAARDCNGMGAEAYTRCMTDNFNRRAQAQAEAAKTPAAASLPRQIQPGEVFATQYLVDLPRKQRGQLAALQVTVELAGERLGFDFQEIE